MKILSACLLAFVAIFPALAQPIPSIGVNASARSYQSPAKPVIFGFAVAAPGRFYLRALGPELKAFGVTDAVPTAPCLSLYRGDTLIWSFAGEINYMNAHGLYFFGVFPEAEAEAAEEVTGASKAAWTGESAVEGRVLDLPAGIYTIMVSGGTGEVLVEAYAVDVAAFDAAISKIGGGLWKRLLNPPPMLLTRPSPGGK